MKNQAKSLIFHGFPCQNLLGAADMLTAGAGGATGTRYQLRRHQTNRQGGGAAVAI